MENVAQVIIVRRDLGMPAGKIIAQACHASMAAITNCLTVQDNGDSVTYSMTVPKESAIHVWLSGAFTKIAVWAQDEQHLLELVAKADAAGLLTSKIVDSGRTVFNGVPTLTCACIGPASKEQRADITNGLQMIGNIKKGATE